MFTLFQVRRVSLAKIERNDREQLRRLDKGAPAKAGARGRLKEHPSLWPKGSVATKRCVPVM